MLSVMLTFAALLDCSLAEVVVDASPLASMVFLDGTETGLRRLPPSCLLVPSMQHDMFGMMAGIIHAGKDGRYSVGRGDC